MILFDKVSLNEHLISVKAAKINKILKLLKIRKPNISER